VKFRQNNGGWRFHGTLGYSRVGTVAIGGFWFFVALERRKYKRCQNENTSAVIFA
jgi:hypothetical protein